MFQNNSDIHSAAANIDVICKKMKKTSSFPIFVFILQCCINYHISLSFMPTSISVIRTLLGMGNTCKSMADSIQCMTKPTTIL